MLQKKNYFAASNTGNGFVSYFEEIFGSQKQMYIIKGGPGTGKSHLMKAIGEEGERLGMDVEYFYCSSDSSSLDGVIINDINTAMIDGTSPHTYDPTYPGVRDHIVNLGAHWDEAMLKAHSADICGIIDRKKNLYINVYNYLAASQRVERELMGITHRALLEQKLGAFVKRLTKTWKNGNGYTVIKRPLEGFTSSGYMMFDTYKNQAGNYYVVHDKYGVGNAFLKCIMNVAGQKELAVYLSPSYLEPGNIQALYLPETDSAFVISRDDENDARIINMERFVDSERIRNNKQKLRFAKRCLSSLYEGASAGFEEIARLHTELESYYIKAMDFAQNETMLSFLKEKIYSR